MRGCNPNSSVYTYVRRARDRWQARVWDGLTRTHINLGLWVEEWEARRVVTRYFNRGEFPPQVLPRFVRRVAGGLVARLNGRRIPPKGEVPYPTAAEAHAAAIAELLRVGDVRVAAMLTADNPGLAAYVVVARPDRRTWPPRLAAVVPASLVEDCRRRVERGGGYAEAARRWAA